MDIRCRHCGEPWNIDELHNVDGLTFDHAQKSFRSIGCETFGTSHSQNTADPGIGILADLLGDDIDGLAAMIEDFEFLGMLD